MITSFFFKIFLQNISIFTSISINIYEAKPPSSLALIQEEEVLNGHVQFSSVRRSVVSNSLQPHESQHARPPCPSPAPGVHSESVMPSNHLILCCPLLLLPPIPPSIRVFFPVSQLFSWCGQSTRVSALASILPKKSQGWSPLGWIGWIFLQSKGLSRIFSNNTVQKHQFFSAQLSSQSNSHIHTWPLENYNTL